MMKTMGTRSFGLQFVATLILMAGCSSDADLDSMESTSGGTSSGGNGASSGTSGGMSSSSGGTSSTQCGDGKLDPNEMCDDGNSNALDGCSATCVLEDVTEINDITCTTDERSNEFGEIDTYCDVPQNRDMFVPGPKPLSVRVKLHRIRNSAGQLSATDAQIQKILDDANTFLGPTIRIVQEGAIDTIQSDEYFDLNGPEYNGLTATHDEPQAVDYYVVNTFGSLCGQAVDIGLPSGNDAAVGTRSCGGSTMSHELGHLFGLWHTHRHWAGPNCDQNDDFCCDTPVDPGKNSCVDNWPMCVPTCTGGEMPDVRNRMSYYTCSRVAGQGYFSKNQVSRMLCHLNRQYEYALATQACVPGPEVCNGVDDDCDGQIDEGVANACGQCGPVPAEVCNGVDDDCDGQIDEGVANACGKCGPVPVEVCNGVDDDCDGQIDEGVANACGKCGSVPVEVCNGVDDDCDGQIDEGVANACGKCGSTPTETCNGVDDDCDGQVDEGLLNACGKCGSVPTETCNAVDDDCDGKIDEGLSNCGLSLNCQPFNFTTASGTGSYVVSSPSGSSLIPIIETRMRSSNGEADGAYEFKHNGTTFTRTTSYGSSNETVSGRVCLLGIGATTRGVNSTGVAQNDGTLTLSPGIITNGYHKTFAALGFPWAYWSGTDDDFEFASSWTSSSLTVNPSGGNSGSWITAAQSRLSLPNGYVVVQKPFTVNNGTSQTLTYTDDPNLGVNEYFVSVLTYRTCGADFFGYSATCGSSSCTISASNGSSCSQVSGYVTQLQWVDNI